MKYRPSRTFSAHQKCRISMNTEVKCSIIEVASNEPLCQIEVHNSLAHIVKKHDGLIQVQLQQTAPLLQVQTEREDPGERLLIERLMAPPGGKEHVANFTSPFDEMSEWKPLFWECTAIQLHINMASHTTPENWHKTVLKPNFCISSLKLLES